MQQEEKELRLNQLRLIVIVMSLIFAFMLVYTCYFIIDYKDKYGFFEKATAEVIEHQEINGKEYDLLSYKVDGNEFRITTEYESKNNIGEKITIYYDTNNPLGVVYSLDSRRVLLPILTSVFAVANIALIVMYILIRKGIIGKNKVNNNIATETIVLAENEDIKEVSVKDIKKETVTKTNKPKGTTKTNSTAKKSSSSKVNTKTTVNKMSNTSKSKTAQNKTTNKTQTKKVDN